MDNPNPPQRPSQANPTEALREDLRKRTEAVANELELLQRKADHLSDELERCWSLRLRPLAEDHQARMRALFPNGAADYLWHEFEDLPQLDQVHEQFQRIVRRMHNAAPPRSPRLG